MKKALRELLAKTSGLFILFMLISLGIAIQVDPKLLAIQRIVYEVIGRVITGCLFLFVIIGICMALGNYEDDKQ